MDEKEWKAYEKETKAETRRLKAEIRRLKRLSNFYRKEGDLTTRIVDMVATSVEAAPMVEVPKLPPFTKSVRDETALLLLSDVHIGKKTVSYNPRVFVKRLRKLERSMMSIITAVRHERPIRKLVVAWGGDIVDAESIYPAQAVEHISIPIIDQIFTVGTPELTKFLLFCLDNFEEVECRCVRGNHGRMTGQAKWTSSKSTNWDFVVYKVLEGQTKNQPRLKWNINYKDWKSMFREQGYGFLLTHGAQIRRYYSLPFYGMTRQALRWANAYRRKMKLTYFLYGHFHSAGMFRFNEVVVVNNGSFVTDDPFAEEYIGVASIPEQMLLGIHPEFGVSWRYALRLD